MQSASMPRPGLARLTIALGVGQIIAWASSYYMLAVLALPISRSTGWSLGLLVSGLSAGLITAGLLAPLAGRTIDSRGGRAVLATSSVLFALGLAVLATSHSLAAYYVGWTVLGVAMSAGLYDAAFSTLGQLLGANAKRSIAGLTLVAGFASTLGWPALTYFDGVVGWRGALWVAVAMNLFVALPVHLLAIPKHQFRVRSITHGPALGAARTRALATGTIVVPTANRLVLIGVLLTCQAAIMATLSVHLIALLGAIGLAPPVALLAGMVIGPAQGGATVGSHRAGADGTCMADMPAGIPSRCFVGRKLVAACQMAARRAVDPQDGIQSYCTKGYRLGVQGIQIYSPRTRP